MRLVAQRPAGLGRHTVISEPWWDKFVFDTIDNDTFWTNYSASQHKKMLKERLKEHGADLIETHFGTVLEFDSDADATAFLLRWT